MPTQIIAETCPAPQCNLSPRDVEQMVQALQEYHALFAPAFPRPEQHAWAKVYLHGLLGDEPRKTIEPIALSLNENVRDLQHFMGQSRWKSEPVIQTHQRLVGETLGEADGVIIADESGRPKQGDDSGGVARQWCGALVKATPWSTPASICPPEWFDQAHAPKRKKWGVPQEVRFQTKPQLALSLVESAVKRGSLPFQWVGADALYGDTPAFRDGGARLGKWYFTEVACSTRVWRRRPAVFVPPWSGRRPHPKRLRLKTPSHRPLRVDELARRLPKAAWMRATIKEGSKGPIVCDFAFLRVTEAWDGLPGAEVWLVIRRHLTPPRETKFYLSNAPADLALSELVRVSGMRGPVETVLEESKGEVGLDQ